MNLDAADNKHNYHSIYQQIPLGVRTITPQNFGSWAHLGGLALTDTARILCSLYKVQTRKGGTLNLNRCAQLFGFCLSSFRFIIFCDTKQRMESTGGKSAKKQNSNLQNFDLPSGGSGIEYPPETGWLWQSDTNRSNSNSRDVSLAKETGPALSLPGLIRELSNGANTGLWFSFPTRNHQININAYIPFFMLLALMPSLGRAVWGSCPKRRHSFHHPLLHSSSFPCKYPGNHAI